MARFRIWGRFEQVDLDRFIVVASAVSPFADERSTFVLTERAEDEADARRRLSRMIARLDERVRAGGGTVSSVDIP